MNRYIDDVGEELKGIVSDIANIKWYTWKGKKALLTAVIWLPLLAIAVILYMICDLIEPY